ncbi:hypothetical protein M1247_11710 [Mycobacterium sp. 21AC1]|uniref:hypothetical protein n=1 Tax=[Mycobacterium] appelbergii TaxID=2939269 RepID=UPI002938E9FD|nr:hypothetical protein [Mycobacterium sp. 21AC1]MDV3125581.1 hypothetical protein [Mycobacterium sp. 21AC1]
MDAGLNPLVNLNNNMAQLAAVVTTALQSDGGRKAAMDAGGSGNFTVNSTFGDATLYAQLTSQLVIVADGPDPDAARRAAAALVEYARGCLNKIQRDSAVPEANNALLIPTVEPAEAVQLPTGGVRAAAAYGLGAVLGGMALLLILDAVRESIRGPGRHRVVKHAATDEARATRYPYIETIADINLNGKPRSDARR